MQPKPIPTFDHALAALDAGIVEADRRERGDFDGLLGGFDRLSSQLLRDVLTYLRGYLLDRYTDEEARQLLVVCEPKSGFRNMPIIDDDIELAIDLLNMIRSAARCEGDKFANLILGPAGARDLKRQAGTRKAGKTTGERKALEASAKHQAWCNDAAKLIASGTEPHNVAAILSARHGVSASTVRRAINKARTG